MRHFVLFYLMSLVIRFLFYVILCCVLFSAIMFSFIIHLCHYLALLLLCYIMHYLSLLCILCLLYCVLLFAVCCHVSLYLLCLLIGQVKADCSSYALFYFILSRLDVFSIPLCPTSVF